MKRFWQHSIIEVPDSWSMDDVRAFVTRQMLSAKLERVSLSVAPVEYAPWPPSRRKKTTAKTPVARKRKAK